MSDDAERYGASLDDAYEEELKRDLRLEGSKRLKPKPTGNECTACAPVVDYMPTPTGRVIPFLRHRVDCPDHPGERIPGGNYARGRTWLPRRRW